ncbi:unnamed protein product [Blepharisma stoltei]|uniref:AAA+ ATPase domain-containing protein n=1 Tax=Blepharisma stoltei TaxID=1481888 RepID=A0AAU9JWC0_9CILI|nr:unnamed protein product [Blepharisma stoltei]
MTEPPKKKHSNRPKSSRYQRHSAAVSNYLKFQEVQQKHEALEKITSGGSGPVIPRPGEFAVFSRTLQENPSREMLLSEFMQTGLLSSSTTLVSQRSMPNIMTYRPTFSRDSARPMPTNRGLFSRDSAKTSPIRDEQNEETQGELILTTQLRNITKPQIPHLLTSSSLAMLSDEAPPRPDSRYSSLFSSSRPTTAGIIRKSGIAPIQDWTAARNREPRKAPKPDYIVRKSKTRGLISSRPSTAQSPSKIKQLSPTNLLNETKKFDEKIEKKDFSNVPRKRDPNEENPGFTVTAPLNVFIAGAIEEIGRTENTKFLPLEMYDPESELGPGEEFIKSVKQRYGKAKAYSKWFYPDGSYEWKECEILRYNNDIDRYVVLWPNGSEKNVSRINLRLLHETEAHFEERLKIAGKFRDLAEIIMKYTNIITGMTSPTVSMPLRMVEAVINRLKPKFNSSLLNYYRVPMEFRRYPAHIHHDPRNHLWKSEITHLIEETMQYKKIGLGSIDEYKDRYYDHLAPIVLTTKIMKNPFQLNPPQIVSLINEVEENFMYAQHKMEFEADLPYNKEKQDLFCEILPPEKFIPYSEKNYDTNRIGVIEKLGFDFWERVQYISENLHQAFPDTLNILVKQNQQIIEFKNLMLFNTFYMVPYKLEKMVRMHKVETLNTIRELRNIMFDTQFGIQDIINKANEERIGRNNAKIMARAYENQSIDLEHQLAPEIIVRLRKLLCLCNLGFEREMRICLERSLLNLRDQLHEIKDMLFTSMNIGIPCERIPSKEMLKIFTNEEWDKKNRKRPYFKCVLMTKKTENDGNFIIDPSLEDIQEAIDDIIYSATKEIQAVPSIETSELGAARDPNLIRVVEDNDEFVFNVTNEIKILVDELWTVPYSLLQMLKPFEFLIGLSVKGLKQKFEQKFKIEAIDYEINRCKEASESLELIFGKKERLYCGLFVIKIDQVQKQLKNKIKKILTELETLMLTKAKDHVAKVEEQEKEIIEIIAHEPANLEELNDMKNFIATHLGERLEYVSNILGQLFGITETLEDYGIRIDDDLYYRTWEAFGLAKRTMKYKKTCERTIRLKERDFAVQLTESQYAIIKEIEDIRDLLFDLKKEKDIEKFEEVSNAFGSLRDRIDKAIEFGKVINVREGIVGIRSTDFKVLDSVKLEFTPSCKLWFYIRDFFEHLPIWMKGHLGELDRESINAEIELYLTELTRMQRNTFKDQPAGLKLTTSLLEEVNKFAPYVPIIKDLRNPGLRDRHWELLQKKTGLSLTKHLNISMETLIEQGIMEYQDDIEDISERATRELALENAKIKMEKEWDDMKFRLVPYKDTKIFIIENNQPIWDLIDDNLVKTISMCNSPYIEFMAKEMHAWKNGLVKLQDILDEWEKMQGYWIYLAPIFMNPDISNELPEQAGKFGHINFMWETMMNQVNYSPLVLEVTFSNPKLHEQLKYSNSTLDIIMKSLNDYLNIKRKAFGRFYFLANEELLAILSNARELDIVQKYIGKCFEGINTLVFNDENDIIGMKSIEGEEVMFLDKISVFENKEEKKFKYVEEWMNEIEKMMKKTLRKLMVNCAADKGNKGYLQWIQSWPSQLIHALNMVFWTNNCEDAIKNGYESLKKLLSEESDRLIDIVEIVRQDLSDETRITISALVVLDVHNKDVIESLYNNKVKDISDFEWLQHLRYYLQSDTVSVKMIDTEREYGYEYLGNQGRLVMTPLTDRCYRTLMGAIRLNLGGAPEGPAGTGKTETTKDLAKSLAKKCVVFNCSDKLDHISMAKFFIGLCHCGAWACFDEFNRIEQEVLSVIAEQIMMIQVGLMKNMPKFRFEDDWIKLDNSCAIFITMNPGYAGRSELPDNLKALFRPVAMMIPDYSMIAEIYLYSYGFKDARRLAVKFITSLRLASEQLSSQKHYDYGMRAVSTIIKRAGALKRDRPEEDEDQIVLQAIQDSNVPKFLIEDVPLFLGITSDLFPQIELEEAENSEMNSLIYDVLEELGLVWKKEFVTKVLQLYDIIQIRHGMMLVGNAMSGKSSIIKVLEKVLSMKNAFDDPKANKVQIVWINPKSVTLEQLYGDANPYNREWVYGILSHYLLHFVESQTNNLKWLIMDGPVDAIWIENMNTVLDDNKKLCLSSGEIIKLTPMISMLFEVENLDHASPATVSRCGMIYVDQDDVLGWKVIFEKWLKSLPIAYRAPAYISLIREIVGYFVEPCLNFVMNNKSFPKVLGVSKLWLVSSLLKVFEALLLKSSKSKAKLNDDITEYNRKQTAQGSIVRKQVSRLSSVVDQGRTPLRKLTQRYTKKENLLTSEFVLNAKDIGKAQKSEVLCFFLFALTWSLGCISNENGRSQFSEFLSDLYSRSLGRKGAEGLDASKELDEIYHKNNAFSMYYNYEKKLWSTWHEMVLKAPKEKVHELSSLIVPTEDTAAYLYLLNKLVPRGNHVLITGATGTGKSVIAKKFIYELDPQKNINVMSTLSAQSSCNQVQDIIESKIIKRKKGYYGPELGKHCIVMIDDLNMPAKEQYGAQPAIEILRQAIDRCEWFDRETCDLKILEDMIYLGAMGHPGGGRNRISSRMTRHFCLLDFTEFNKESLENIFTSYLHLGFQEHSQFVKSAIISIASATIDIYHKVLTALPPTPAKSHYTFNLRDITNICLCITSVPSVKIPIIEVLYRLWIHECLRVFSDRLINDKDKNIFIGKLKETFQHWMHEDYDNITGGHEPIFCNFIEEPVYQEVSTIDAARKRLEVVLYEYSIKHKGNAELIMFDYAVYHIIRISRIISLPSGHALLIGIGGSGRVSLCKLAAFIQEYNVFQIQMSKYYDIGEWKEDLKNLFNSAGQENQKQVFLVKDTDLNKNIYFENINNILNSGEVPNLYTPDEKDFIAEQMREKRGNSIKTSIERWEEFVKNCRKNLHIVLSMSDTGENLRQKLRQFPSFVNCCTIDWFNVWPEEALVTVAKQYVRESGILTGTDAEEVMDKTCVYIHQSVLEFSETYYIETMRRNHATPANFLHLLMNIKGLYEYKKKTTMALREKYTIGVQKLDDTQEIVEQLKKELIELKPVLIESARETDEIMKNIQRQNAEADKTRSLVAAEQQESAVQAEIAEKMKQECEEKLSLALPELDAAKRALKTLKKQEINEVRKMLNPPVAVKLVVEAVVIINQEKPIKIPDPNDKSKFIYDFFEAGKKMMNNPKFIQLLKKFNKDSLTQEVIDRLQPYISNPKFEPSTVKNASNAAEGLCKWVMAMVNYFNVSKDIKPKQEALNKANDTMAEKFKILQEKEQLLKGVEEQIRNLKLQFEEKDAKKQQLISDIEKCELKMARAVKLIEKLGGERKRWSQRITELTENMKNLLGDIVLSAGVVSYLGNFIGSYRDQIVQKQWIPYISSLKSVTCSEDFSLKDVVGDPLLIQNWILYGLPNDKISIENALIIERSKHWPLIIDPQGQAVKFLKKKAQEERDQLVVTKPFFEEFMTTLENALFVGATLILENVDEKIDPILDPILSKNFYEENGVNLVKIGDTQKQCDPRFKFYMATRLVNPHYGPEIASRVTILNFTITQEGLIEQLLSLVCMKELPKESKDRNFLVIQNASFMKKLQEIEDQILKMLQSAGDTILDDENLINQLTVSKDTAEEIEKKLQTSRTNEQRILEFQSNYRPVADLSSVLYFCVSDMVNIDPMYFFSLEWFSSLFVRSIGKAQASKNIQTRIQNLISTFRQELFLSICMSLSEKDKFLFSFLMAIRLLQHDGLLDSNEFRFLLTGLSGFTSEDETRQHPINQFKEAFEDKVWDEICELSYLSAFSQIKENIQNNIEEWKKFSLSTREFTKIPEFDEFVQDLPDPYSQETYSDIEKLLLYRVIRPENVTQAIYAFIKKYLGEFYLKPPLLSLENALSESEPLTPLIFILTSGNDPQSILKRFASENNMNLTSLSLGKAQGEKAVRIIRESISSGSWVLLQNCHLALSWMPDLDGLLERLITDREKKMVTINPDFRLWLTCKSNEKFPITILQQGVKITHEPPKGLKNNLISIYQRINMSKEDKLLYESSKKPEEWHKLFFGLAFFHCLIRERKKFGALGWNVQYEFNDSDLNISMRQLKLMIDNYTTIPYKALNYLAGECNYGGRVTDDWDRRTLKCLLSDYYRDDMLYDHHRFSESPIYYAPPNSNDIEQYIYFVEEFPYEESPQVFGLHENAKITYDRKETYDLFHRLLMLQPRAHVVSRENEKNEINALTGEILGLLSEEFDIKEAKNKYPIVYELSMNIVLVQELLRYNNLLRIIKKTTEELNKAMAGEIIITEDLENMAASLLRNQVPTAWMEFSYPSSKPLLSWSRDLGKRLSFFQKWVNEGPPSVYWISGFFFTQAFLTGNLQNCSRKYTLPIDSLEFTFAIKDDITCDEEGNYKAETPENGCYIHGLFIEGARWNSEINQLDESLPRALFSSMPVMHLNPGEKSKSEGIYYTPRNVTKYFDCPVYKTANRAGVLSTTGHSTNYVMTVKLPSVHPESHWVKRGVALLTQLDD